MLDNRDIHLIWIGAEPEWLAQKIQQLQAHAGSRRVRLHRDDADVLPCYRPAYERLAHLPQTKSDFIRQSVLELYGGWYFDFDATLRVSMDDLERSISGRKYACTTFGRGTFNPDVLYCPKGWPGWSIVHRHVEGLVGMERVGALAFAARLVSAVAKEAPHLLEPLRNMRRFPYRQSLVTKHAWVLRQGTTEPTKPGPATVTDDLIAARRETCSRCRRLRKDDNGKPYCRKHQGRCKARSAGMYVGALLRPEPWCKPWRKIASL